MKYANIEILQLSINLTSLSLSLSFFFLGMLFNCRYYGLEMNVDKKSNEK